MAFSTSGSCHSLPTNPPHPRFGLHRLPLLWHQAVHVVVVVVTAFAVVVPVVRHQAPAPARLAVVHLTVPAPLVIALVHLGHWLVRLVLDPWLMTAVLHLVMGHWLVRLVLDPCLVCGPPRPCVVGLALSLAMSPPMMMLPPVHPRAGDHLHAVGDAERVMMSTVDALLRVSALGAQLSMTALVLVMCPATEVAAAADGEAGGLDGLALVAGDVGACFL